MDALGVYKAINAVQGELAKTGIAKDRKNEMQGYKFRGIDEVYNALSPLLAKHGLVILPRVLSREVVERTTHKGTALFYVTVKVEFDLVAVSDGSRHIVVTYGEAMDSGDKATNKAMSAAYKYAVMEAFAIPTEGDNDADAVTHEVKAITPGAGAWEALDVDERKFLEDIAAQVKALISDDDVGGALDFIGGQKLGADEKVALNTRFDSKERSAMKKYLSTQTTKAA